MTGVAEPEPRPHCYRCDKPELSCLCARIPLIDNQTPIVIVQHKRESRHALGTVRIADLGLSRRHVAIYAADQRSGSELPPWLPAGAGLLYPGPLARDLAEVSPAEQPQALVVIDGTWHQARALFRDHAWLRELPHWKLTPHAPSRYRLRREPAPEYVSTIEAIVQALSILEPETPGAALLAAFDAMIDDQIHHARTRPRVPREHKRRLPAWRRLPLGLLEHFDRLVFVYGEATHPHGDLLAPPELVHWTALRACDGSTFDSVLRPAGGPPASGHLRHLGLDAELIERGATLTDFHESWNAFLKPGEILAAWNPRTLGLLERSIGRQVNGFGLKGAYHRERGQRGDLTQINEQEGLHDLPGTLARSLATIRGRAQQRLSNVVRVALLLRTLAGLC